jgi:hypothetical protein
VRALRNPGLDMVLLALLAPRRSGDPDGMPVGPGWSKQALGQLLLFRSGLHITLTTESRTDMETRVAKFRLNVCTLQFGTD